MENLRETVSPFRDTYHKRSENKVHRALQIDASSGYATNTVGFSSSTVEQHKKMKSISKSMFDLKNNIKHASHQQQLFPSGYKSNVAPYVKQPHYVEQEQSNKSVIPRSQASMDHKFVTRAMTTTFTSHYTSPTRTNILFEEDRAHHEQDRLYMTGYARNRVVEFPKHKLSSTTQYREEFTRLNPHHQQEPTVSWNPSTGYFHQHSFSAIRLLQPNVKRNPTTVILRNNK